MIAWIKKLFRREKVIASLQAKNERHAALMTSLRSKIERNEQKATAMGLIQNADPLNLSGTGDRRYMPMSVVSKEQAAANQQAERIKTLVTPPRPAARHQVLSAGYKPVVRREGVVTRRTYEPTKDTSSDDIYLAMAAAMLLTDPPAPSPASCSAPSFSSGGGGDYGGGGASGSWDSGSSSSSDSSSSSSDSGSSSSSSD